LTGLSHIYRPVQNTTGTADEELLALLRRKSSNDKMSLNDGNEKSSLQDDTV